MSLVNHDVELLEKYQYLVGIDEVGRGCLAGPLVVCGVIMKYDCVIDDINDSKKLSEKKRNLLYDMILDNCLEYHIIEVDVETIDKENIYQATKKAMQQIAEKLNKNQSLILSDAMPLELQNNLSIIKGDAKSYSIACASILAKVYRDRKMIELAKQYPNYDFENNKGYGTKKHLQALDNYGYLEDVHRKTYEPIKSMCNKQLELNL